MKTNKETSGKSSVNFWTRNFDFPLVVVAVLLILVGLLTLLSASSSTGLTDAGSPYYYVIKQAQALGMGLIGLVGIMFLDYRMFNNKAVLIIITILIFALIAIVQIAGIDEGGARRWLNLGGINFQPSEFIKLGMIVLMAGLLQRLIKNRNIKKFWKGFILPLGITGLVAGLILILQNHLSAAAVIGIVAVVQMFIAGVNMIYLFSTIGLGASAIGILFSVMPAESLGFRGERILAWLNPEDYAQGKGFQTLQSLYAIGSGGWFGVGIGESRQKQDFLPFPQNDFIASIFAEEFGFIGVIILLLLFMALLIRSALIAHNAKDMFGKLLGIGITTLFAFEIILNLLVITNLIPVTGIGLPFFSYGGTAMIVNLLAIGILLSIYRISNRKEKV